MSQLNIKTWKHKFIRIIVEHLNAIRESEYAVILVKKTDRDKLRYVTFMEETPFIHAEKP